MVAPQRKPQRLKNKVLVLQYGVWRGSRDGLGEVVDPYKAVFHFCCQKETCVHYMLWVVGHHGIREVKFIQVDNGCGSHLRR